MTYQIVTAHAARFKRWASSKANMILNIIDTVFWFALFIISIMGTSGSHSTSSRALGVIIVILALVLWYVSWLYELLLACIRKTLTCRMDLMQRPRWLPLVHLCPRPTIL